ncbi:hypothetical protein Pcinc_028104 [Petrolisthes cinctipes]|uniref:Uncharacterized protein n=1 Tax=Petrolisthes cinctipes TaxID=88211 RepID=A0AAE1F325_PETCI|nr:hypothetical protein Pcinc_028104 [Petrolisthes cinctipes]
MVLVKIVLGMSDGVNMMILVMGFVDVCVAVSCNGVELNTCPLPSVIPVTVSPLLSVIPITVSPLPSVIPVTVSPLLSPLLTLSPLSVVVLVRLQKKSVSLCHTP